MQAHGRDRGKTHLGCNIQIWGVAIAALTHSGYSPVYSYKSQIHNHVNRWVITRVTENSISTIKFYRVFLKIYERWSEDIWLTWQKNY